MLGQEQNVYEHSIGDESREGTKDDTLVIIVGLIYVCLSVSHMLGMGWEQQDKAADVIKNRTHT